MFSDFGFRPLSLGDAAPVRRRHWPNHLKRASYAALAASLMCAVLVGCSWRRHPDPDLTFTQTMTMESPQFAAMMAAQPGANQQAAAQSQELPGMGPMTMVTYVHGTKTRVDLYWTSGAYPTMTTFSNDATGLETTFYHSTMTYSTRHYSTSPFQPNAPHYHDTGEKRNILGYICEHYTLDPQTYYFLPGGPYTMTGDVWQAADIATPPGLKSSDASVPPRTAMQGVKGMPLLWEMHNSNPTLSMTVSIAVTSISQTPLPTSVFVYPANYASTAPSGYGGG